MKDWQKRLLDDNIELSERIIKLQKYINKTIYECSNQTNNNKIELMLMQLNAMTAYQQILQIRIEIEIPRKE